MSSERAPARARVSRSLLPTQAPVDPVPRHAAHDYKLGSRSALEWALERYQVKKDKPSGIVSDPNDRGLEHDNPRYILDLIGSIVTICVETVRIVSSLPPLDPSDRQALSGRGADGVSSS